MRPQMKQNIQQPMPLCVQVLPVARTRQVWRKAMGGLSDDPVNDKIVTASRALTLSL